MTIAPAESARKPTGLVRGQAAKIARTHRVTTRHVIGVARGEWGGRPALLKTIENYRARNVAAAEDASGNGSTDQATADGANG